MPTPQRATARVEAFSDAVFAIAMTLLVLEFKVPEQPTGVAPHGWALGRALLSLWPSLVAFVLSFGSVLIMWINHHDLFGHVHRIGRQLLFANGFLLLLVTFVPFPTAVLAGYLNSPAAHVAAIFYCGTYVLVSLGYNWLLHAAARDQVAADASPARGGVLVRLRRAYRAGLVVYLLATLVSAFSALGGLAICFSLWFLWALLNYGTRDKSEDGGRLT